MSTPIPSIALSNGVTIPQIGFGVFQVPDAETEAAVSTALEVGYRHVDTATIYGNEAGVGKAIATSALARSDIFVTSKLWPTDFAAADVRPAIERSLERLGLDVLDLYLLHWPAEGKRPYVEAWEGLLAARSDGLIREVGVSNFTPPLLDELTEKTGITPAINQIQLNPALQQKGLHAYHRDHGIVTEAWSPIAQGRGLDGVVLSEIAQRHDVTPAQVVLRWHLQAGTVIIPKSVHRERMAENLDLFGFELTAADVAAIDALDEGEPVWDGPQSFQP